MNPLMYGVSMAIDQYNMKPCRPEDIPAIIRLEARWLTEDSTIGMAPVSADDVRAWLGPFCWLAERDGEVVGFAYATIESSEGLAVIPAGARYLRLEELYVLPDYRNQGIGGRLVDRLLAEASAQGITRGRVYSSSKDWRRIEGFYQRHGFQMWYVELYR
jgi:GNAT superfamily N-acetyltransferase